MLFINLCSSVTLVEREYVVPDPGMQAVAEIDCKGKEITFADCELNSYKDIQSKSMNVRVMCTGNWVMKFPTMARCF